MTRIVRFLEIRLVERGLLDAQHAFPRVALIVRHKGLANGLAPDPRILATERHARTVHP